MILGKTKAERLKRQQKKLKKLYGLRKKFVFLPVKLKDGRIAWLEWVNVKHPVFYDGANDMYFRKYHDNTLYYIENK